MKGRQSEKTEFLESDYFNSSFSFVFSYMDEPLEI